MATIKDLLAKMIDKINDIPTKMSELEDDLPVVQADWNETDETQSDYIKNKPSDIDAMELAMEFELISPVADENGSIYTDENGAIYSL